MGKYLWGAVEQQASFPSFPRFAHQSGQPDRKENDMSDTTNKPIDNSKEELTEAELDQVAGGVHHDGVTASKAHTKPELSRFGVGPEAAKPDPHGVVQ
jgi:hypothetical protein